MVGRRENLPAQHRDPVVRPEGREPQYPPSAWVSAKCSKRKRYIITDTQGLVLVVRVHPANHHDSKAALDVIRQLKPEFKRMRKIYADGGCRGYLKDIVKKELKYTLKITIRNDKSKKSNRCQSGV